MENRMDSYANYHGTSIKISVHKRMETSFHRSRGKRVQREIGENRGKRVPKRVPRSLCVILMRNGPSGMINNILFRLCLSISVIYIKYHFHKWNFMHNFFKAYVVFI